MSEKKICVRSCTETWRDKKILTVAQISTVACSTLELTLSLLIHLTYPISVTLIWMFCTLLRTCTEHYHTRQFSIKWCSPFTVQLVLFLRVCLLTLYPKENWHVSPVHSWYPTPVVPVCELNQSGYCSKQLSLICVHKHKYHKIRAQTQLSVFCPPHCALLFRFRLCSRIEWGQCRKLHLPWRSIWQRRQCPSTWRKYW